MSSAADPLNESTGQEDEAEPQVVEGGGKGVAVIKPALVFNTGEGGVFDVPKATVKAVDDFEVPRGYKREGTRERSFMYSLGVYVVPVKEGGKQNKHKYSCLADTTCRRKNCVVPRDCGGVNAGLCICAIIIIFFSHLFQACMFRSILNLGFVFHNGDPSYRLRLC